MSRVLRSVPNPTQWWRADGDRDGATVYFDELDGLWKLSTLGADGNTEEWRYCYLSNSDRNVPWNDADLMPAASWWPNIGDACYATMHRRLKSVVVPTIAWVLEYLLSYRILVPVCAVVPTAHSPYELVVRGGTFIDI